MKFMRKHLSFLLALVMLATVLPLSMTSCLDTANTIADAALEAIENYEADKIQSSETGETGELTGETIPPETEPAPAIDEDGWYNDRDSVALYIHTYGKLPPNYVSKEDAERLYGWEGGSLDVYEKGMAIGGSKFGNYEGLLPKKSGRQYYECDIDTVGVSTRGTCRIVYSNDGLIYYTGDHYESFEILYGEE